MDGPRNLGVSTILNSYNNPPQSHFQIMGAGARSWLCFWHVGDRVLMLPWILEDVKHMAINALNLIAYACHTCWASCQDQRSRSPDRSITEAGVDRRVGMDGNFLAQSINYPSPRNSAWVSLIYFFHFIPQSQPYTRASSFPMPPSREYSSSQERPSSLVSFLTLFPLFHNGVSPFS